MLGAEVAGTLADGVEAVRALSSTSSREKPARTWSTNHEGCSPAGSPKLGNAVRNFENKVINSNLTR